MVRQGKGRKDRLLPIGERACAWIQKYLDDLRPGLVIEPDHGVLFINDDGQPFIKNRLGDLVKKVIQRAGINKPGSCHLFRHAMATQMLEHGADIRYIQVMLGHSDLSTTQIYTQVSIKKLQAVHAMTHPASLGRKKQATERDADTEDALKLLAALETEVGH
jgi:integrase/recombinase XerD